MFEIRILFSIPVPSQVDFFLLPFLSLDHSFFLLEFYFLFAPHPFLFIFSFETFSAHPPSNLPTYSPILFKLKLDSSPSTYSPINLKMC